MRKVESDLQSSCVCWFRYAYPEYSRLLFAVPNGGSRNVIEAARLKKEGVVRGVSDLLLLVPNKEFHGLCIEMKKKGGYQSEWQKEWQKEVEKQGYLYVVCKSFAEFMITINKYFKP